MNEDNSLVPPVVPGIFTIPQDDQTLPELIGGYCRECNEHFFPCPKYCQRCLGAVERAVVGRKGTIYSYTVIRVKPPLGLPSPYAVGYIDLEESGLRIFCLLDPKQINQLRIGLAVELSVDIMGHDGQGASRQRPFFTFKK
jgi:uncharacterized OB-fold protein